jgi:DNA-3-methyladenine glycosylase II
MQGTLVVLRPPILLFHSRYPIAFRYTTKKTMVTTRKRCLEHNDSVSSRASSFRRVASASSKISPPVSSSLPSSPSEMPPSLATDEARRAIEEVLRQADVTSTRTKSGWCLKEGLAHLVSVDDRKMMPLVRQHGPPLIYAPQRQTCRHDSNRNKKDDDDGDDEARSSEDESKNRPPQDCFQSLCRIVAGQQLAGAAAKTVWNRLQATAGYDLTPPVVLALANRGLEQHLQKPAGLSAAKARSILALAEAFTVRGDDKATGGAPRGTGALSDDFLTSADDGEVREALLAIRGIGPWSCDMFMMFYLERPNILPIGDLGVRKGIARHFGIRGKAKGGSLCPQNDAASIHKALHPYRPYQSLAAYYMWRVADTKEIYQE